MFQNFDCVPLTIFDYLLLINVPEEVWVFLSSYQLAKKCFFQIQNLFKQCWGGGGFSDSTAAYARCLCWWGWGRGLEWGCNIKQLSRGEGRVCNFSHQILLLFLHSTMPLAKGIGEAWLGKGIGGAQ